MNLRTALRMCALMALVAGAAVSAQVQLPSAPPKQFGSSVTPAFEGWFYNPDGTQSLLIGYYSRNTEQEVDIPIGPNNHFEPGNPDMGQPTHFLTRRRFGMFVVTVPKEFGRTEKIWWTLTVNGVTNKVPLYMHTDYNVSPFKSTEESPNGAHNAPAILQFEEKGPSFQGPGATLAKAVSRTATVGTPMPLNLWADDDALYSTGGNAPMTSTPPPVNVTISKYRGPGQVTIADARPKFETLKGGKPTEPYSGKTSTTVTFSQPGDYMLHVTVNDYSGNGGGGSGCCWTTAIVKVSVSSY
ncbi:MAG: hypothetical protein HY047_02355 [Acidobacteria bacterium]|nr:hypothetical protein [Acidobacteriota bacterium]